jgi:biotin transport system permease protein
MISGYVARRTWLHRVPAVLKLAGVAVASVALLPVDDWRVLAAGLAGVALVYASLGRDVFSRLAMLRPILPILIALALLQGLFQSWPLAAASSLRILLMILIASLATLTTTMQAMMAVVAPLMAPLRLVGINPRAPALAVTLVLRFVPVLLEAWQQREEAWRARTGRRASIKLIPAFIADAMRMADQVAEALDARGFSVSLSRRSSPGDRS